MTGPTVAFLGDSITAGYNLPLEQAYPALLHEQLAAAGTPFRVINAGVSGDTSAGGLRRVDWLLTQKPAVVVIELGGNDGLRGAPTAEIERNLRAIIGKVRAAGATAMLLGMRLPPSYGDPYAAEFAALYDRVAEQLSLAYVPFFMRGVAGVLELTQEDGLHPTHEGQRKLAANVAPALTRLLTTP
ncbi:MAG TPA: arylesterase [Polyangiales bacterium]